MKKNIMKIEEMEYLIDQSISKRWKYYSYRANWNLYIVLRLMYYSRMPERVAYSIRYGDVRAGQVENVTEKFQELYYMDKETLKIIEIHKEKEDMEDQDRICQIGERALRDIFHKLTNILVQYDGKQIYNNIQLKDVYKWGLEHYERGGLYR